MLANKSEVAGKVGNLQTLGAAQSPAHAHGLAVGLAGRNSLMRHNGGTVDALQEWQFALFHVSP
jgi:hypothetical protein